MSYDGMQAGRLLVGEKVQQGVRTVRDPFLAGGYIRRTSLLCDSPSLGYRARASLGLSGWLGVGLVSL